MVDIEKCARDLLRARGFDAEFYTPDPIREGLVVVSESQTLGSERFVGRGLITCQCWGASRGRARETAFSVRHALVEGLAETNDDITGCGPESGPYRFDDPDVKQFARWQFTVEVYYNI